MYPAKFMPNCFKCFPLHRAAANGSVDKCEQLLLSGEINPYQPTEDGWTALHVAIANKAENVVDLLLDRFEQDWQIVRQTIKHQFLWKVEQMGWKKRPILIAWTEEECEAALTSMSSCPTGIPLNLQIFVLVRNPNRGRRFIALDVCNQNKWCDIMRLVRRLLANGVLSFDRCDMRRDVENYLHLACALSTKEIIVKLISRGASLTVTSGTEGRTPLMAAGEKMRKDVIDLLTTKYADRVDPCACDRNNYTVLHQIMQRQHTAMVEYFVNFLLNYRTNKLHESKSVALSKIFSYESTEEDKTLNVWHLVRSAPMKKLCEKYIRECQLDVRIRLCDTTTLGVLIDRNIALQYCFEQIEQDLTLLQLQENGVKLNILHNLIRRKQLAFVEALYRKHGSCVREMFEVTEPENDAAYDLMRVLMYNADEQGIKFVLKYHRNFYTTDMGKLRQVTVKLHNCSNRSYGKLLEVIAEEVPKLREDIDSVKLENDSPKRDFYDDLRQLRDHFAKTVAKLETNGKRLDDYLDSNRQTFLHAAVRWSDKLLIEKLLARNMDVMKLDDKGCLPIHLVYRSESIFEMLLRSNESAQLSYVNEAGHNLLHIGCRNGLGTVLEPLVNYGMDVNGPTPDGQLPLSLASCCATVTFLLDRGARIDLLNGDLLSRNLNHMHYCAARALIPRLIPLPWFRQCAHMYLPWMVGEKSRYLFSYSSETFLETQPDIRRLLFDSLYEHSKSEMAELFTRVCHNAVPCCVKWFLEYDYDIDYNYRMWDYSPPLLGLLSYVECDMKDQLRMVEKLLQKSIDVNATNEFGRNALMILTNGIGWMRHCGQMVLELASSLLKHGIRLDAQDEQGNTALHNAFQHEQWEMVEFLIENGANVSVKNKSNKLACDMALEGSRILYGNIVITGHKFNCSGQYFFPVLLNNRR